jgi:hypothetical protein
MILCQAIKRHVFGDNFRMSILEEKYSFSKYQAILKLFSDNAPDFKPLAKNKDYDARKSILAPFGIN